MALPGGFEGVGKCCGGGSLVLRYRRHRSVKKEFPKQREEGCPRAAREGDVKKDSSKELQSKFPAKRSGGESCAEICVGGGVVALSGGIGGARPAVLSG